LKILAERSGTIVVINSLFPRAVDDLFDKIKDINKALECFAEDTDNVEYFDADDIFLKNGKINLELLPDGVHPKEAGAEAWGEEIVKFMENLMK
jgi:lysophospholipase L1-like esterase